MRILIFHGYLLRGTGSNIYNASLVRALARLGHEVELVCQERRADELDLPDAVHVTVPDIGGVLPVYVADRYEGYDAVPTRSWTMPASSATSRRTCAPCPRWRSARGPTWPWPTTW